MLWLALLLTPEPDPLAAPMAQLEALRGLRFKQPVPSKRTSVDQARQQIVEILQHESPAAEIQADALILERLELIPKGYDLYGELLKLLADQVAGFYDPYRKQFVLVDFPDDHPMKGAAEAGHETILIHELDHALNDQHFDVIEMIGYDSRRTLDDEVFARHALAEGDATLVMYLALLSKSGAAIQPKDLPLDTLVRQIEESSANSTPTMRNAPDYLRAALVTSYSLGLQYVGRAWQRGGWAEVNARWSKPPASSEQLLHADRENDPPQRLDASSPPRGYALVSTMQLGELGMRLWLKTRLSEELAFKSAAGWDGDRVELFRNPAGASWLRVSSVWDTAAEAEEFRKAATQWCGCLVPATSTPPYRITVELK
jgi:hypothetical protein